MYRNGSYSRRLDLHKPPLRGGHQGLALLCRDERLGEFSALPNLQDLPLPLAVIIAAFWIINQNNAEFAKKLVALIDEFTGKYEALIETVLEERKAASDRWLERDRLLNERLERNTIAQEKNANEAHQLRGMVTPLILSIESDRKRARGGSQSSRSAGGGDSDAAD